MRRRTWLFLAFGALAFGLVRRAHAQTEQVELDRVLVRIGSSIITQSDVRQARMLHLVPDTSSDAAVRTALENRLLMLAEIARGTPLDPVSDGELDGRRHEWETQINAGPRLNGVLTDAGMTEASLTSWLRDDCRVRKYVARQFGQLPDADRDRAQAAWVQRLRVRAGLR